MPNLQLVKTPSPVAHQPAVLTQSMEQRLAAINRATRTLRELGLKVVWAKLAGPLPQVHIQRDLDKSIAPLLDRMGPRSFHIVDGCRVISGELDGVIVSWAEPQH